MLLAHMIALDEDDIICDFAETYGVYDYESLPVKLAAILACGLRDSSRIRQRMDNVRGDMKEILLAGIQDRVNWLAWSKTENGQNNVNRPDSILDLLLKRQISDTEQFDTPEAYEIRRKELLKGGNDG